MVTADGVPGAGRPGDEPGPSRGNGGTTGERPVRVGVLAVQGGVREHVRLLESLGAEVVPVRRASQLADLEALVLPGGESTVIDRLTRILSLAQPIRRAVDEGLPVLGTCAGLILLADRLVDPGPGQHTIGGLDVTVRRNAFGPQIVSSEEEVRTTLGTVRAAYIRAPEVLDVGPGVEVLARRASGSPAWAVDGNDAGQGDAGDATAPEAADDAEGPVVAVARGDVLGIAFHPELTGDTTIHTELLRRARARRPVSGDERPKQG